MDNGAKRRDFEYGNGCGNENGNGSWIPANAKRLFCIDKLATSQPSQKSFQIFLFLFIFFSVCLSCPFMTHHHKNASIKCAVRMPSLYSPWLGWLGWWLGHSFYQTVKKYNMTCLCDADATRRHWRHSKLPRMQIMCVWRVCK